MLRRSATLAAILAAIVLPERAAAGENKTDLGAAPRRMMVVVFQLALALAVGLPLLAITQPFVPLTSSFFVFAVVIIVLGVHVWRSIKNLQGHVRAGAELVVDMLAKQSRHDPSHSATLPAVEEMLPGLPGMTPVRIGEQSAALGRSIGQLNLRLRTGVAVLAIHRTDGTEVQPIARHKLDKGDVITLAGSREAVDRAVEILEKGPAIDPTFLSYTS